MPLPRGSLIGRDIARFTERRSASQY
jgi:hypothetical protein